MDCLENGWLTRLFLLAEGLQDSFKLGPHDEEGSAGNQNQDHIAYEPGQIEEFHGGDIDDSIENCDQEGFS